MNGHKILGLVVSLALIATAITLAVLSAFHHDPALLVLGCAGGWLGGWILGGVVA